MYNLSSKIIYALIGLLFMTHHDKNKPISIQQIAKHEKISRIYLERIFHILVKTKILKSIKGSKGGFVLNTKIEDVTLLKLINIFETKKQKELTLKNKDTEKILYKLITKIEKQIEKLFKDITLSNIIKEE